MGIGPSNALMTVVGARPQFIKAAPVSQALAAEGVEEILVHTGQHYDDNMSRRFFDELDIPSPAYNLGIGSDTHGRQTGRMLIALEELMLEVRPAAVVVYGDTNSTLAGALAAAKLEIPLGHAEAGLRSYNRSMPEEHNRILTDHASDLLFCPTRTAVDNLENEGVEDNVHLVGDTMYDAVLHFCAQGLDDTDLFDHLSLDNAGYALATIHRPHNTDEPAALRGILEGLIALEIPVVFPVHPRTRSRIEADPSTRSLLRNPNGLRIIGPVGYLDMLALERGARVVVTDSGGIQKEAYFLGVPCVTVRPETEWVETLDGGWNRLVDPEPGAIASAVAEAAPGGPRTAFGDGRAAQRIVEILSGSLELKESD